MCFIPRVLGDYSGKFVTLTIKKILYKSACNKKTTNTKRVISKYLYQKLIPSSTIAAFIICSVIVHDTKVDNFNEKLSYFHFLFIYVFFLNEVFFLDHLHVFFPSL